jgi:hypothetical protein
VVRVRSRPAGFPAQFRCSVYAEYDLFTFYDPACDEPADLGPATSGAIADGVGWAESAVAVRTTPNVRWVTVEVTVASQAPPIDDEPLAAGALELPTGRWCVDRAVEARYRLGVELPAGAGSYAVRLLTRHRDEVRRRRDAAFAADRVDTAAIETLRGLETYQFHLWRPG